MITALEVCATSPTGTVLWLSVPTSSHIHALAFALDYVGSDWTVELTGTTFSATKDNKIAVLHTRLPIEPADD